VPAQVEENATIKIVDLDTEGTADEVITEQTEWKEYEFKCKPGDISRKPCVVSPYHYRLDWQIWFAAMSPYQNHPWILNLINKLLQNDPQTLGLLESNPFAERPRFIRASLYEYRFTTHPERQRTGNWWVRKRLGDYLPALSLQNPEFKRILKQQQWT
jgi:hypothetical protein